MTLRTIETDDDIAEGCAWLAARCVQLAQTHERLGPPPLRRRPGGFSALVSAIVSQQLSVASAQAVRGRLEGLGGDDPVRLGALDDAALRSAGLSRQKISYLRALVDAGLDYSALAEMPDEEAIATLTAVKGIGRWTAEIYLMFSLGRPDVIAADDLALQVGAQLLYGLEKRPTQKALRDRAEAWAPWRAVAARLLWSAYADGKKREGVAPV
ncbi:MAG: DNA-3-methyladenine glycosylase family protein [Pikeienuella sp.]